MSTHNIGFYEDLTKLFLNYHQISSNMHLISSAVMAEEQIRPTLKIFLFPLTQPCFSGMGRSVGK